MQCLCLHRGLAAAPARGPRTSRRLSRRLCVVVKAHEEDEVEFLPIWSGRLPEMDPEKVPKGHNLGGKTLGEELGLLHDAYVQDEVDKDKEMHAHMYTKNWQGDVYVGSNWNILTVLLALGFATPLLGLLFAFLSYGTLWTGHYYGI